MITATNDRAVAAYAAINRIRRLVRGKDAKNLFHLKVMLQEHVDFVAEEELKLIEAAGGQILETGMVLIADREKRAQFEQSRRELGGMECAVDADEVTVSTDNCPEVTMEDIEQLAGFVNFD